MNPLYHQARFLTSAARLSQAPPDEGFEIAFAGRSNAGKSSAINVLCQQKGLARTSKTPGRTRLLNFFELDKKRRLVDLPGYGFAKVEQAVKQKWQQEMAAYLEQRESLCGLILVMDIRHPLTPFDSQMLDWSGRIGLPVHALLTKSDKLSRGAATNTLAQVSQALGRIEGEFTVQLFSALRRQGLDQVHRALDQWLGLEKSGNEKG